MTGRAPTRWRGRFRGWWRQAATADRALFDRVAALDAPALDRILPRLSRAADRGLLWAATATLLALLGGRRGRRAALRGLTALGIASATVNAPVKLGARRHRPPLDFTPLVRRLHRQPTTWSFPSGHAASAGAFATGAALEDHRVALPLGLAALGVAASRVYVGVHYPVDVAVGVAVGVTAAVATTRLWPLERSTRPAGSERSGVERPSGRGVVIVVNAESGPQGEDDAAARLETLLPHAEIVQADPSDTDLGGLMERAARDADVLGVAGGDGTIAPAADAAIDAGIPLLVIPAGTRNNFARTLGIATIEEACAVLADGRTLSVDVGEIADRSFVNAASLGGYPELVEIRERLEDRIGKWPATAVGLVRLLREDAPVEVELDGRRVRAWLVFFGNCAFDPAGYAPTRRHRLDDGLLDVRVLRAEPTWSRVRALVGLASGRVRRSRAYEQRTVGTVAVAVPGEALTVARDGETFTGPSTFTVTKRRGALGVLVPPG